MERTTEYLKELQSLPLDEKVAMTKMRIVEWYEHWNGNVSVSFSGGKDSTVLLDIVRSIYPDVPAVFVDTGLEQPEIREFVRRFDNVTVVRPSMPFNEVLSTYGYPLISKEVSEAIWYARKNTPPVNKKLSGGGIQTEASRAVGTETDRGYATRTRDGIYCSDDGSANAATVPQWTAQHAPQYALRNMEKAAPRERERERVLQRCGIPERDGLCSEVCATGTVSQWTREKRAQFCNRQTYTVDRATHARKKSALLWGGAANPRAQSTIQESNCVLREGQKEKGDTCRGRFVTHDGASKSKPDDGEYP